MEASTSRDALRAKLRARLRAKKHENGPSTGRPGHEAADEKTAMASALRGLNPSKLMNRKMKRKLKRKGGAKLFDELETRGGQTFTAEQKEQLQRLLLSSATAPTPQSSAQPK